MNTPSQFSLGRIALHLLCAFSTRHWAWHGKGIVREFITWRIARIFNAEFTALMTLVGLSKLERIDYEKAQSCHS
jgi:hypothetical protein